MPNNRLRQIGNKKCGVCGCSATIVSDTAAFMPGGGDRASVFAKTRFARLPKGAHEQKDRRQILAQIVMEMEQRWR